VTLETTEVLVLDERLQLTLAELAELARVSEPELVALIDCGLLPARAGDGSQRIYGAQCVVVARTARRLRADFELDPAGLELALTLLARVRALEDELRELRARLPRHPQS
jgi:chaperone modulatory protein CbpM